MTTTNALTQPGRPAGPNTDQVLAARGLMRTYGSGDTLVRALDGVDVDFRRGSFTAVMGPSGSGKSTLMHCLAGLDAPTAGTITLGDLSLTSLSDRDLTTVRRDRFGFVFQSFNLFPNLTAQENILLPLDLAGRTPDKDHFRELVAALGISDRLSHRPAQLSGGQQQRVAIARAMITQPDIVFADEPTGALDTRTGTQLLSFLRSGARELGQTIVMVTHDPTAAAYSDRALLLSDGRIAGSIDEPRADDVLAAMSTMGSPATTAGQSLSPATTATQSGSPATTATRPGSPATTPGQAR